MTEMREFTTGATRSSDVGKIDPEGFLSPLVLRAYCDYLNKHRVQADGKVRASDNWQKGMGRDVYMKSAWRHFLALWTIHRGWQVAVDGYGLRDSLCAVLFNVMGYLHEMEVAATFDEEPRTAADTLLAPNEPLVLTQDQALDLDKPHATTNLLDRLLNRVRGGEGGPRPDVP